MTKVTVIPIDLGFDIRELINEGVEELTGQAKQELDTAIAIAKDRDALRKKQDSEKNRVHDAISEVMRQAYDKISESGENGILCDQILEFVSSHIPNSSAFTLRMKKMLRDKGNPYSIVRKKMDGAHRYLFIEFNGND